MFCQNCGDIPPFCPRCIPRRRHDACNIEFKRYTVVSKLSPDAQTAEPPDAPFSSYRVVIPDDQCLYALSTYTEIGVGGTAIQIGNNSPIPITDGVSLRIDHKDFPCPVGRVIIYFSSDITDWFLIYGDP
jgi:hypothetical protein